MRQLTDARYRPPKREGQQLGRSTVMAKLLNSTSLTVLIAPSGSGKTWLLSAYYDQLQQADIPAHWLSLGSDDNTPATFNKHWHEAFVAPLISTANRKQRRVFFIDGMEELDDAALVIAEQRLLELAEQGKVIATIKHVRSATLHDARLRTLLDIVDATELKMTVAEAAEILGPQWSPIEIERLHRFVDGWPAGLRLLANAPKAARLQLKSGDDSTLHISALADYFTDVLCAKLTATEWQQLMELSVFNRLTPRLLVDLPELSCNWEQVQHWVASDLLLSYGDLAKDWVVFHPAFGCYLRHRLRQTRPKHHAELTQFAASWFAQHGFHAEAIRQAVNIDETQQAARIIEQVGAIIVDAGNGADVSMANYLPTNQASEFPLLFLGQIYHRIRNGKHLSARQIFDEALAKTANFTRLSSDSDPLVVRSWVNMLDVTLDVAQDHPISAQQIELLEADLSAHLASNSVIVAGIASILAFVCLDLSRYSESTTLCSIGLHAQEADNTNKMTVFLRMHQASAALAIDSIEKAVLCIEDAQRLAKVDCGSDSYEVLISQIMRGVLHYENNELDRAWNLLWPALQQVRLINGWVRLYAEGFAIAAMIASIRDGFDAADAIIRHAESFANERQLPRLTQFMAIARLRAHIRAEHFREAKDYVQCTLLQELMHADSLEPHHLALQIPALLEQAQLMLELERPRDALSYLGKINKDFLQDADSRLRFSFRVLTMRASWALRRYNATVEHLQAAIDIVRHTGLIRRALDVRRIFIDILDGCLHAGRTVSVPTCEWINQVLRHTDGGESALEMQQNRPRRNTKFVQGNCTLSPRESEIMALIAEGCINKEIAKRLVISEGTVKTHRKKIHEKLGVSTRSQAIARARELLII